MAETKNIHIKELEVNKGQIEGLPQNPRFIKDERFRALKKSIEDAPEMLALRELIVYPHNGKFVIIAGNMRFRACKELGYKEIPCKVLPEDTPVENLREYTIKDNIGFGADDWDLIANEWDIDELDGWGMELPDFELNAGEENGTEEEDDFDETTDELNEEAEDEGKPIVLDILLPSDNDMEIPCLLKERMAGRVELPITPWGANSRLSVGVNTYHFYVDDYRFNALFKDPTRLIESKCRNMVEPNVSLHDQTPIAYGMQLIYKKRWLARYMQEMGVNIYVDLNVSRKFAKFNLYGIPEGWDAFFTRGLTGQTKLLESDLEIAKQISGKETPNLIVYGGGRESEEFCQKNGLLYITDFINSKNI